MTTAADAVAGKAHGLVSSVLADIESIPHAISGELAEAKSKLGAALAWIEAHLTTQKKAIPVAGATQLRLVRRPPRPPDPSRFAG